MPSLIWRDKEYQLDSTFIDNGVEFIVFKKEEQAIGPFIGLRRPLINKEIFVILPSAAVYLDTNSDRYYIRDPTKKWWEEYGLV